MTNTDLPELDGDAMARIEEARKSGEDHVRAAREEGLQLVGLAADCAIGSDSELPSDARKQANSVLAQALADALLLYFNVSTYEYFVVTPGISEFTTILVNLDAMATSEFPGAPFGLEVQKRSWMSRASGRATLQRAAGQVNMTFWHDLQAQFQALGCPHAYAVPGNGWWHIDGLPNDPSELDSLKSRLFFAIRQAVAGLGFTDTPVVDVAVWLDLLRHCCPHYSNRCINNLCMASAEYCREVLEVRTVPPDDAGPAKSPTKFAGRAKRARITADSETRQRRRGTLRQYGNERGLHKRADLARHLAISQSAIDGMVCGDTTRYSEAKLSNFLKTIGVSPDNW